MGCNRNHRGGYGELYNSMGVEGTKGSREGDGPRSVGGSARGGKEERVEGRVPELYPHRVLRMVHQGVPWREQKEGRHGGSAGEPGWSG